MDYVELFWYLIKFYFTGTAPSNEFGEQHQHQNTKGALSMPILQFLAAKKCRFDADF